MKTWEASVFTFNYAFDNVCSVFYNRYPNSQAKHIVSEDVLSREITKDYIITRKLIVKQGSSFLKTVPRWLTKSVSLQYMPTVEESVYDRNAKTLTTSTKNVSFCKTLKMTETCVYKPQSGVDQTDLSRHLYVSVNYGHLSALAERFLVMGFRKSTKRTVDGFLEKLQERFGAPTASAAESSASNSSNSVLVISDTLRNKNLLEKM